MKILTKFKEMSLLKKIIFVILVVVVIGAVAGGGSNDDGKKEDKQKDNKTQDVKEDSDEKKEYGIGELVSVGDVDYLINSVEVIKEIGGQYANTQANDTFLIIDISITNNDKEALTVSDSRFKLLNNENEYSTDSTGAIYLQDNSIIFKELNPGVTLQGKIVFDVPESVATSNETKLQVQTDMWGNKKDAISLAR